MIFKSPANGRTETGPTPLYVRSRCARVSGLRFSLEDLRDGYCSDACGSDAPR